MIDPDFLFLNRFELPKNAQPVLPGKPAAAKYGLGGQVGIEISMFATLHMFIDYICLYHIYN